MQVLKWRVKFLTSEIVAGLVEEILYFHKIKLPLYSYLRCGNERNKIA